ncbi:OadG family protein [bacterium]|nr:OadG family protein [bacterium]
MTEKLLEASLLLVAGMTAVFVSLSGLALMIWLIKSADEKVNALRIRWYAKKVEVKPEEVHDELAAVISAAVFTVLRKPVTIRKIRFLDNRGEDAWAVTGRLNIMASRPIRKRK